MTNPNTVTLELGEGFSNDEVTVLVDGHEVWRASGVTTNYSVGIADVVRLRAPSAGATVEVRVGNLAGSAPLAAPAGAGEVRLRARLDPAGAGLSVTPAPEGPMF